MYVELPHQTHTYVDSHFDEHLARTQTFLRQPSISAQNIGVRQCADLLRGWLIERGAYVEYHGSDSHPILFAEWHVGAPKTLLVYGMYDVQPVDDQPWASPPFAAEIREHNQGGPSIIARGACNSKGPLMAFLHTIEALRATGGLPVNIKWTIEGEEEIGSYELPKFYEHYRDRLRSDAAFEPFWSQWRQNSQPELTLGTKGDVSLEIICRSGEWGGPREVVHSSAGPWLKSPAWRLVRALASLVDENQDLNVEGIPRLGTLTPEDEALLAHLARTFDVAEAKEAMGTARFKRDLPPIELLRQMEFGTALNINGIVSGYTGPGSHTIIPNIAKAKLDLRLPPGVSVEQIYTAIESHFVKRGFPDLDVILDSGYPAARTPLNAPVVQTLMDTYRAHGYEPVVRPLEASATPYYLYTDVLGLPFAWGGLGSAGGSHGPDEWCSVQGLKDMKKSLATYLVAFARG
ncbi:MAG TPA: M20/M25/M40 family metallo-hydrolase [Anaerolineales bacterium]|nr:M20/M25/M40 family metallo-hydrolase [Anaerolineales bacterium]